MATSRTSYAIGNAERLAGGGRSFVRNEIKRSWSGGRKFFTQDRSMNWRPNSLAPSVGTGAFRKLFEISSYVASGTSLKWTGSLPS